MKTTTKTQVKRAVITQTRTVNEFQLGEIDTPHGLSGGWPSIEDYHAWLESDLGLTIIEEMNLVIHNQRGTCYRYTDSTGGFSLECVWEEQPDENSKVKTYRGPWSSGLVYDVNEMYEMVESGEKPAEPTARDYERERRKHSQMMDIAAGYGD